MDFKTFIGKTIFFAMIVAFVAVFSAVFGDDNSLIGVMIIVAALMLMGRSMSAQPGYSLFWILFINLSLGVGTFISSMYPVAGIAINFVMIFSLVFLMSRDLRTSVEFPFLLGFALMMSVPVTLEELPIRLASLTIGALFIVGLNLLVNRGKNDKITSHSGIIALLETVEKAIALKKEGSEADPNMFREGTFAIRSGIFDRLQKKYYSTPESRSVMNMAVSIEQLGRCVCRLDLTTEQLEKLEKIVISIKDCTAEKISPDETHKIIQNFLKDEQNLPFDIESGLELIDYELLVISKGTETTALRYNEIKPRKEFDTRLKEALRADSPEFSYAFRLALLITIFEFVASFYDVLAARWLTFTAIAMCIPYMDIVKSKAKMRITGAVSGILIFTILTMFTTDPTILVGVMLFLNYIYTLFDPLRYDVKMMFTNISALITAVLTIPTFETGIDDSLLRLACILGGTVIVIACNHLILPYKLSTANLNLGKRSLKLTNDAIISLCKNDDSVKTTCDVLTSDLNSEKIRRNLLLNPDDDLEVFLHHESEAITRCAFYRNTISSLEDEKLQNRVCELTKKYETEWSTNGVPANADAMIEDLNGKSYQCAKGILETMKIAFKSVKDYQKYEEKVLSGNTGKITFREL